MKSKRKEEIMDFVFVYAICVLIPVCVLLLIVVPPIIYIVEEENKNDKNTYDYFD